MAANKSGAQLSKNVLQMKFVQTLCWFIKFMQRSVLRIEQEQNEEDRQKVIDDEHWVLDLPEYKTKESPFLRDQSYVICEDLVFGRQSYQGFNPEIEKLMLLHKKDNELQKSEEKEKQDSTSDTEMAKRLSSLSGIIAKKFAKKRSRNNSIEDDEDGEPSKKKFIKPVD